MIPPFLKQRFEQLLTFAKDPAHNLTAYENIAAAKELVDTLYHCDRINTVEYNELRAQAMCAQLIVSGAELKRADDALNRSINRWDGCREKDLAEFLRKSV